ncbi:MULTISPECIES: hypothetical protein [unclassified Sphingobacterium]|uniref:hypothetical protein n=1 Tax=unclassified Sphingobacterium TaxID=2609468 RepID=UPI0025D26E06|nr:MULTISPECIES: hypothetical protein [unclassified Sphingobacterium]
MNGAHWHLILNHLPLIFPLVGLIVLITGFISKSEPVKRTAFLVFILGALATIAAMATGEGAEDVAEKLTGVTKDYIHVHEEVAETFALLSYIIGLGSLLAIWASITKKSFSNSISICLLAFALVLMFFAKKTGTTGGEIRHEEIRTGFIK